MLGRATYRGASSLAGIPLFSGCTRREISAAEHLGTRVHVDSEVTLIQQDHLGREFVLLLEGLAHCLINGRTVAEYRPGDFFGELSLLDGGPRTASIIMVSAGELHVFEQREFFRLLEVAPSVVKPLLVEVVRRQRTTMSALLTP